MGEDEEQGRRPRAVVVAAVVLAVLVAVVLVSRSPVTRGPEVPAYRQRVADGLLPRYYAGGRAVTATSFSTDDRRTASVEATLDQGAATVSVSCAPALQGAELALSDGKGLTLRAGCGYGQSTWSLPATAGELRVLLHVVAPDTALTFSRPFTGHLPASRVGVAVYAPVPRADFPLPPRPARRAPLQSVVVGGGADLAATGLRANGTTTLVVPWSAGGLDVSLSAVAPGELRVRVDGRDVGHWSSWTWTPSGYGLTVDRDLLARAGVRVRPGQQLRVMLTASQFTARGWQGSVSRAQ